MTFDHDTLVRMADWNDLDLNVVTVARSLAEIGSLGEQEILDLLANPAIVAAEGSFIDEVKMTAMIRWVELLGPKAFVEPYANKHLHGSGYFDDTEVIAQGFGLWTLNHPDEARRWLEERMVELNAEDEGGFDHWVVFGEQDLLTAMIQNHERARKGKTRELASLCSSEEARDVIVERLAEIEVGSTYSPEDLQEFLDREDRFIKHYAIEKLLTADPQFARDWISRQSPSGEIDAFIVQAAESYLGDDFSEGAQWFLQQELSNAEAKSERLVTLVSELSFREDGGSASEWLRQQPDTAERDRAEMFMARQRLRSRDIEGGIAWLTEVTDPELRQQLVSEYLPDQSLSSGINRNSIDAILNNPLRSNSDFIGVVDRVHIPGIPVYDPDFDRNAFREAAERAGLIQPEEAD